MNFEDVCVELLPARTVLSTAAMGASGGFGGDGADGKLAVTVDAGNTNFGGLQANSSLGDASGGDGGSANGGGAAAAGNDQLFA